MDSFPAFFPLRGGRVVVAGHGAMADAKARLFEGSPATVERIAGDAAMDRRSYEGARLAFVAGDDREFRRAASAAARAAHVPVNVVDDADLCDFHTPALIDRGSVVVAVGTAGASPLLAAVLRDALEAHTPRRIGVLAALLGRHRGEIRQVFPDLDRRSAFLRTMIEGPVGKAALGGDADLAAARLEAALAEVHQGRGGARSP
ncbi:MAG TPA: bifunctional precorrin-2 dehydrogenase/sirohydrochlorin ferrochelatase [Caulobacteraceae bacterium]